MNSKEFDKKMKELEKKYSVIKAKDIAIEPKIRTGIFGLDIVLDGGIAQCLGGHKIEFAGKESSGKTTASLAVVAKFQELGKNCVWINAENSYSQKWAEIMGVDNDKLIVFQPKSLEDAGNAIIDLIPHADLIVLDSIAALIPEEELDKDFEDKTMAAQAKVFSPICRKIHKIVGKYKTVLLFINQIREKVGVMFGNPQTIPGGHALKHLFDSRIEFRLGKPIEEGKGTNKERIGTEINLKCTKNKKGKPQKKSVIDFYYTGHIDNKKSLFFQAIKYTIISRSGAWFEYKKLKEQGQEKLLEKLTEKDWDEIESEIWKRIK